MARIGIFGAGWVGLVTGACLAELGHDVVIRDIVPEKIEALRAGQVPFHEEDVPELLERNRDRLSFTLDVREVAEGADFLFVCVDTPPTYSGDADLSRVWTVVDELPRLTRSCLVMKSTVPVGTGEKVRVGLDARGLEGIGYVSNPEFLAEGRAVADFMNPDRIVIGAYEEADGDAVEALYEGVTAPVVRCDVNSAEMIKLAANAFLMTRISFINEIANVCELTGADVTKVAEGIGLDHRLGPHFLRAGIGYGGSCLAGEESVLTRRGGRARLLTLETLFDELSQDAPEGAEVLWPDDLEALAWDPETDEIRFMPVGAATRRRWGKPLVEVRTKMGRRVRCTPDHPFLVSAGAGGRWERKLASELTNRDWLPLASATPLDGFRAPREIEALAGMAAVGTRAGFKRIAPAGYGMTGDETSTLRVTQVSPSDAADWVYSLEIPGAHTFVTTGGLVVSNCFPKDSLALKQLASNSGYHFQLLSAVIEVNELQKRRVVAKLQKHLGKLHGKRVALLGLAFKPNTDDMREAPSIVLASRLLAEGADVTGWDPVARPGHLLRGVEIRETPLDAVRDADAAVIVTEWPELRELAAAETLAAMRGNLILDGRNLLEPDAARAAGFVYEGVGRPSSPLAGLPETEEEPTPTT